MYQIETDSSYRYENGISETTNTGGLRVIGVVLCIHTSDGYDNHRATGGALKEKDSHIN